MVGNEDHTSEATAKHVPRAYPRDTSTTREQMVERHLGLARHLARRYSDSGEPLDDLVQVASLGLVKAVDRFDPERGVAFTTFAVPTILGELRRHFRDRGWALRVPRDLKDASLRVSRALAEHNGRSPTPADLALKTGMSIEEVVEALEVAGAHRAVSLDAPARIDGEGTATLLDQFGAADDELERAGDRATLSRLTGVLDEREREILRLRFEEDLTQREIGDLIGVSQMQVSRLIRAALTRMREAAGAADGASA